MLTYSPFKRLVKLSRQLDTIIASEADRPLARFPLTDELAMLFGHWNTLYFEATINHGMLTLGNNVAPPK